MKERQYINNKIVLLGKSNGQTFERTFYIKRKIDEGSSGVCYEANHESSGTGVLKEYYPKDLYSLERTSEEQLIPDETFGAARESFRQLQKEYIEPYEMLLHAKQSGDNKELSIFIPEFEIYYGFDKSLNAEGTIYIWTPYPKLRTFDQICREIQKNPEIEPERKLVLVLSAMRSLAKCICALHKSQMIHRDIKPSNFGFLNHGDEILTETLSMFDIDSVCSVYNIPDGVIGTKGYMEPECGCQKPNNKTDIYAIGAVLFHAIAITEETEEGRYLYHDKYYERIREFVDHSRLIRASEANSHPRLRNILTVILQKCLAKRKNRYGACEELLNDLKTALYYALPSEIAQNKCSGEQWILRDIEKSLDAHLEKNSTLAMQYHLYQNPLYRWGNQDSDKISMMIVGFGNYGQKFLDLCLQFGQMKGKRPSVMVVSDDPTDKSIYLSERPALSEFFHINQSMSGDDESYGEIFFEDATLSKRNDSRNKDIIKNLISGCNQNSLKIMPQYIFIALGDDELNRKTAKVCKELIDILGLKACVNFAAEKKNTFEAADGSYPVYVCENMKDSDLYGEIERMAFNTHLIWEKNLNIDQKEVKIEFLTPYFHDSSVSNVISMKYKLFSMGIDLDFCSFEEAAEMFCQKTSSGDEQSQAVKDELIYLEHKRWVVEKICDGWKRISDLQECLSGITKDEKNKRHICIVRSRPESKLTEQYLLKEPLKKWDDATEEELAELDELDRMSVELHRVYANRASEIKKQNLLGGSTMAAISMLVKSDRRALIAFQEWFSCLKDLWNGDRSKVKLYKSLKNRLMKAVENLQQDNKKTAEEQIKTFETMFYPILASMEYTNYKAIDKDIIENIPFVLTYTDSLCLVIPYSGGNNNKIFSNVAAATMVNPGKIVYLSYLEKQKDIGELKNSLAYVFEFMHKKNIGAAVEFVVAYSDRITKYLSHDIETELIDLSKGRISAVKAEAVSDKNAAADFFLDYLSEKRENESILAVEQNDTKLSNMLAGTGVYGKFASYEFDSEQMEFMTSEECKILSYIRKKPFISVSDMTSICLSSGGSCDQPEFYGEYHSLWEKYWENKSVWKQLCKLLGKHAKTNDRIGRFAVDREKSEKTEELRYIIPFSCRETVEKILNFLKQHAVAGRKSCIGVYTTDSCEVLIEDRMGNKEGYDSLFANVYALMDSDAVKISLDTAEDAVEIVFDNLVASHVELGADDTGEMTGLMHYFAEKGFVINYKERAGFADFTYATRQIKELLTNEKKMLQIYVYHKMRELNVFDDVVSTYEIEWKSKDVKSRFDCIITKGFKSLFVGCTVDETIKQELYYELSGLARQFGINATAVLVADAKAGAPFESAGVNDMQLQRGNMLNVITVWKTEDIHHIGDTLLNILNGTDK